MRFHIFVNVFFCLVCWNRERETEYRMHYIYAIEINGNSGYEKESRPNSSCSIIISFSYSFFYLLCTFYTNSFSPIFATIILTTYYCHYWHQMFLWVYENMHMEIFYMVFVCVSAVGHNINVCLYLCASCWNDIHIHECGISAETIANLSQCAMHVTLKIAYAPFNGIPSLQLYRVVVVCGCFICFVWFLLCVDLQIVWKKGKESALSDHFTPFKQSCHKKIWINVEHFHSQTKWKEILLIEHLSNYSVSFFLLLFDDYCQYSSDWSWCERKNCLLFCECVWEKVFAITLIFVH